MNTKPLLICLTPVRNEAWVLDAFLTATSLWADHIIIADQNSTDSSREIYKKYPKVQVIENNLPKMQMSHTRQLLFDEANKINGSKIVFTLDADEVFADNFMETAGWKSILNSQKNDVFEFKWVNLYGSFVKSLPTTNKNADGDWVCNYGEKIEGDYPDNYIHEPRLKYPESANWLVISDLKIIHFARLFTERQKNKENFYQISTVVNEPKKSAVSLFRHYYYKAITVNVDARIYDYYRSNGIDFEKLIKKDIGEYYLRSIIEMFDEKGTKYFQKLDIWDKTWLKTLSQIAGNEIRDPRNAFYKLLHFYFRKTNKYNNTLVIRYLDKVLKRIIK
ncbi:hypothetical protein FACS1894180_5380 [Bacteroidia bacterium]|nr:hypothetical protein FACS1894180_5380 [Bacteroidia bacterium]